MSGRLDFEYGFSSNNTQQPTASKAPMRVYFLGDFTGAQSALTHNTTNKIVKIDIDNFDDVMTKLNPTVNLPSGHLLTFNELEDFHPDSLFNSAVFKELARLKKALANSATAEQASQEIMTSFQSTTNKTLQQVNTSTEVSIENDESEEGEESDDMFERLLGQKQSSPAKTTASPQKTKSSIDSFLADLLSPHIIKDIKPEQQHLMMLIDTAIENLMNSILHGADFRALEAAWRSVRDVIFNEEYDDESQSFYIINTDKETLKRAVEGDLTLATQLSKHIKNTDVTTQDVLIGNYQFCADNNDISTLNYLASLAETLKCLLVTAPSDSLINADETSLWHAFRETPQAKYVALSYPQILLRIPYGEKLDEIEDFAFEEFRGTHQHNQLLWGNSAFACARLLVRQYHGLVPFNASITELPAYVCIEGDEQKLTPCSEHLLSEQQLINIRSHGINPFVSFRHKNSIRLFGDEIRAIKRNEYYDSSSVSSL